MRSKRVIRYYCDFCSRGKFRKPDMERHERGCTANPNRICGLCERVDNQTKELKELLDALADGGIKALSTLVEGCPACTLTAVRAWNKLNPGEDEGFYFDYKAAAAEWWKEEATQRMGT